MSDPANLPTRIDRAAVDRVLARALELQASGAGEPQAEQLTEAQLLELAKEVGLDPVNLRQALAEERTRVSVPEERGMLAALYGPAYVSAQRTVAGTPAQVLKALDDWMQRQEGLCAQRYFNTERVVWELATRVAQETEGFKEAFAAGSELTQRDAVAFVRGAPRR